MEEKELDLNAWYFQLAGMLHPERKWLRPEDGCALLWSMFWGLVRSILFACACGIYLGGLVSFCIWGFYKVWLGLDIYVDVLPAVAGAITLTAVIVVLGIVFGVHWASTIWPAIKHWHRSRKGLKEEEYSEPGFVSTMYHSVKNKYCFRIKWKKEDDDGSH